MYKTESLAKDIEDNVNKNSNDLKQRKNEAKELMDICNKNKSKIEEIKGHLNEKKLSKVNLGVSIMLYIYFLNRMN